MLVREAEAALKSESRWRRSSSTHLSPRLGVGRYTRFGLATLAVCAGYYAACVVGFDLRFPSQHLAAFWPANAVLAAALTLLPSRRWWVLFLAVFPAHLALYAPHVSSGWEMVWLYLYRWTMAAMVAGALHYSIGARFRLDDLRQMTVFVVVATAAPALVGLAGTSMVLSGWTGGDFWLAWRLTFLGNLLAFLTLFPALVMIFRSGPDFARTAPWHRYAEFGLLGAALFAVGVAVFGRQGPHVPALFYAPLPFLLWAAVRFGPGGLSLSLLVVVLLSIASAISGRGPFPAQSAPENVFSLQVFLIAISVPLMFLAALIQERANRERVMRLAQERYELATSGGEVGVWDWDVESGNLYLGPVLKSILGYEDGQTFYKHDWSGVFHPDDLARAMERVEACAAGQIPRFELELRIVRKDGSIRWLLDRGNAVKDRYGKVVRLVGTKVDITERKRAEEALRDSEERNRAMLRAMPDLMFLMSKDGVYLDYHAKEPSQLYIAPVDFIGKNIRDVLCPEVADAFHRSVEQAMLSGEPATHEYSLAKPEGAKGHFERRLVDCGDDRVLSIVRDITERRRAEEALRDSEERNRTIFELTTVGATESSTDGTFIRVNDAFCGFTGYSRDELLGLKFGDITYPEDKQECIENLRRMLSGELPQIKLEKRYLRKDGEIIWVEVNAAVVHDASGQPLCLVSLVNDITDRKRVEQLLREEFRVLTESMPQIVWASRPDGHLDYYNRRWYELTSATEGATGDESWLPVLHPDDRQKCLDIWYESVRTGSPYQIEYRFKYPAAGEYHWHLGRALPVRDEKGLIVRWVGTSTDIHDQKQAEQSLREISEELEYRVAERTAELSQANSILRREVCERKQAEEALRESERQFRAIFDRAAIAIALVGCDGRPFESNPALVEMLGYSAQELRGMRFTEFTHPSDVDLDVKFYRRLMEGKIDRYRIEKRYHRKDGRMVWAILTVSLVRDGLGQPRFAIGMAEDITERKRAEEKLHETQTELAHIARVTALGELAASIAHEVNQPLAAIVGNADICLNWLKSNPSDLGMVREALIDIVDDGNRAGQVIARVRSLIKKSEAQSKRLDINEIIREAVALVSSEAARRRVILQAELCPNIPLVLGDRVQLQQVLLNLMMNGFEAMTAIEDRPRELLIKSSEYDSACVVVEVRDTGPGIDPADLERVFSAFYTTKSSGIGIGLSICRSIINAHGGKLWSAPNPERGAIFDFTLPACVGGVR